MVRLCIDQLNQASWKREHHVTGNSDLAPKVINEVKVLHIFAFLIKHLKNILRNK